MGVVTACYYYEEDPQQPVNVLCSGDSSLFGELPAGCDTPIALDGSPVTFSLPDTATKFACKHYGNVLTELITIDKLMLSTSGECASSTDPVTYYFLGEWNWNGTLVTYTAEVVHPGSSRRTQTFFSRKWCRAPHPTGQVAVRSL